MLVAILLPAGVPCLITLDSPYPRTCLPWPLPASTSLEAHPVADPFSCSPLLPLAPLPAQTVAMQAAWQGYALTGNTTLLATADLLLDFLEAHLRDWTYGELYYEV